MLIGLEKKFVFVANTKTASTSIEKALLSHAEINHGGNPRRKHISLHEGIKAYPEVFAKSEREPEKFFKFGVMRDPLDWISSWFRYRKGNNVESPLPSDMTFEEFWARKDWNILRRGEKPYLQCDMFCHPNGEVLADAIVPYDRLDEVFARICAGLEIESALSRDNVSRLPSAGEIAPSLADEMRDFYARDYELLGRLDAINEAGLERLMRR